MHIYIYMCMYMYTCRHSDCAHRLWPMHAECADNQTQRVHAPLPSFDAVFEQVCGMSWGWVRERVSERVSD